MKISYLVTCSTEKESLHILLTTIQESLFNENEDELVILYDDSATNNEHTKKVLSFFNTIEFKMEPYAERIKLYNHSLNADYGAHKNFGIEKCTGNFIFQLDGDELPSELTIGNNLKSIIESNPKVECIYVPRINDFIGVNEEHAKQWGWRLSESKTYKRPMVNFPDFQSRIFKNDYPRISYKRKLHEKIEGYNEYSFLPAEEEYALYHDKTIEKQIETNIKYNKVFTVEENRGHKVV